MKMNLRIKKLFGLFLPLALFLLNSVTVGAKPFRPSGGGGLTDHHAASPKDIGE